MKRLKIVEQIIIVLLLAVAIPFITIGIIISNISQQSVRNELVNNASTIAQFIGESTDNYVKLCKNQLDQLASAFNHIPDVMDKLQYFDEIEAKSKTFKSIDIVEKKDLPNKSNIIDNGHLILHSPIDKEKNYYLEAKIDINIIDRLLTKESAKGRHVYIFDSQTNELIVSNTQDEDAYEVLSDLKIKEGAQSAIFGHKKNTPKAYYEIENLNWFVIVDTTKKITAKTIIKARYRIIIALSAAALFIFIMVGLYTSYLYINIRQLFKGITAISKGNYDKKIHLIKRVFTPHEIIFLAKEFNYMAKKINVSYRDLRKKNKELQNLNEFRENLVNATSHEFRTPLTSIIGYTSRLLRNDIVLDDETRVKSLKTIKQQAQRLSAMVEDLLVIPELDSFSIKLNFEETDLINSITKTSEYLYSREKEIVLDLDENLKYVYADVDRLEQILINLIDNAKKYALDGTAIKIEAKMEDETPIIKIINKCEKISDDYKEKLFEKFTRVDSKLTRTTRGTGLGLYIVKGLCQAMNIEISLDCDEDFIIKLKFNDYV